MSLQNKLPKKLISKYSTKKFSVNDGVFIESDHYVVKEEKYGIYINGNEFASVMLVPDKEKEFFYGFLYTSKIINKADDIKSIRICDNKNAHIYLNMDLSLENDTWTVTSGCGGGKVLENTYSIEEKVESDFTVSANEIISMYKLLESESILHKYTRCVHKSYFFGKNGYTFTCEDIGRHNTIDKAIGSILISKENFEGVILTTGRLTSEMVLKCARAKIPVVVSRTAPSKLGVEIAKEANITLIGLTSMKGFTIFCGQERIV